MKRLSKYDKFDINQLYALYKFAYILGAFNNEPKDRQRACEFLYNIFSENHIPLKTIHQSFKKLKFKEFDAFFKKKEND